VTTLSVIIALLPRFCVKFVQKVYFPYDIDIVREQVRQGKFDYLNSAVGSEAMFKGSSTNSSDIVKPSKHTHYPSIDEDQRPIYPPSVAQTATTHNPRSQSGSDGTDFTRHRSSLDPPMRPSTDRARPSFGKLVGTKGFLTRTFGSSRSWSTFYILRPDVFGDIPKKAIADFKII
jgi:phospholipid-translocating ATPase